LFYLLEAGTATGDVKMVYLSPDMKPITKATSYSHDESPGPPAGASAEAQSKR
jgi:hypothetical protein